MRMRMRMKRRQERAERIWEVGMRGRTGVGS